MPDLSQRLVYEAPGMAGAVARRGLAYRAPAADSPLLNVYAPPSLARDDRLPAVLFIHGGPVYPAPVAPPTEWGVFIAYGELCAATGLVGVTFNHRFYDPTQLEVANGDVRAAVEFVRAHADELQIDAERLALWAFSGGGPFLSSFLRERPPYIRCIAANYALLDLRHYLEQATDTVARARLESYSAATCFTAASGAPPLFVARGGLDSPLINASIDRFVQNALAANAPIELMNHPHGRHGFDILDDDDRTREITARGIEFMRRHLGA